MNRDFLLNQDLLENRQFKFYQDSVLIKQSNGTNPRIRRIGTEQKLQYTAITEMIPEYEVRVILSPTMNFRLESVYSIEYSSNLIINYKCVAIEPSNEQGLYVKIILCQ